MVGILLAAMNLQIPDAHSAEPNASRGMEPGERIRDARVVDVEGKPDNLLSLTGKVGAVIITRDAECPVSQRYLPRIRAMAKEFAARGFNFVILDVTPQSAEEARAAARSLSFVRTIADDRKVIATLLGAETTAEAFVIDSKGTLRYRGAIDDQYGISHQRATVGAPYLRRALEDISKGEAPHETRTEPPGCVISPNPSVSSDPSPVTYYNQISRIIQSKCQICHRAGGLGPMPLETYRQVYERRAIISAMVGAGRMPPWFADPHVGSWANDRSLSGREKQQLLDWARGGGAEGDMAMAPLPRRFSTKWNIGEPDAVVKIPQPITVPAQGPVGYQYVYTKTDFPDDRWVTAVEIRPTQPKVVHHVIVLLEEPGRKALPGAELARLAPSQRPPQPGNTSTGFFAITVPGSLGIVFPAGTGKRLPKGAWLKFEVHYQPNGSSVVDRTEVGFRFSSRPVREVQNRSALSSDFAIPPHNPRYKVEASYKFCESGKLLSLFPHMHLRGAAFRYELALADGRRVPLLEVPRFDFNWQSFYEFRKPQEVAKGTKLVATAWYDNSKNNPWNPDPSQTVRWGQQTTEEMMIGYFDFVADGNERERKSGDACGAGA